MQRIVLALAFLVLCLEPVFGQAQFPPNTVWGNPTGAQSLPRTVPLGSCTSTALLYTPGAGFSCATATQLTAACNVFSSTATGCVPVSPGGISSFLRADGAWVAPTGGGGGSPPGGTTGQVQVNAGGGSFGGITNTQLTAQVNTFTAALSGAVPAAVGASSLFLRGDGTWAAASTGSSGSNPTALVGLSAVNGSATSYMRSDAAPALSQAISPTWTGNHTFNPASGTAITVNPATGTNNQALNITQTTPNSGTQGTSNIWLNQITLNDGNSISPAGTVWSSALNITQNLLSNILGQKTALFVQSLHSTATATTGDQIAITAYVQTNSSNGGTDTGSGAKGTIYVINPILSALTGASNYSVWSGGEVDMDATGGSTSRRIGWSVANAGTVQGVNLDTAFEIASTNAAGSFKNALTFTLWRGGTNYLDASGSLITDDGSFAQTITNGISLPAWTFSGSIFNFKTFRVEGNGKFGYNTGGGAGAAVTQLTNRTTAVTLNKPTGQITLFNAAGNTTSWTAFAVNDSAVAANDNVVCNFQSNGANAYICNASTITAGLFVVYFISTGGTAADAPTINFSVIKGSGT